MISCCSCSLTRLRAREAGLDPAMRMELWDKTAKVSFDKRMLAELMMEPRARA